MTRELGQLPHFSVTNVWTEGQTYMMSQIVIYVVKNAALNFHAVTKIPKI